MPVQLQDLDVADLAEALELWANTEGVGLNEADAPERLELFLKRNPGMSVIARDGSRVAGAMLCGHDGRRGYLHHLAVAPDYRRQGLARKMVQRCLAVLDADNIWKCNIFLYNTNDSGRAFWSKLGFNPRGDLMTMSRTCR